MSAFVVGDITLNIILKAIRANRLMDDQSDEDILNALVQMNADAVSQLYDEPVRPHTPEVLEMTRPIGMVMVRALGCYLYQCDEGDVPSRELFQMLVKLRGEIAICIVTTLAGYDAPSLYNWGD